MKQTIKYESDLNRGFTDEIRSIPGCERVYDCIQCGTCSATCPLSLYMDYTPRRLMAMIKEGFEDDVLRSQTIWLCASCYACSVRCPRQIAITDVMYALKRRAIRKNVYPARFPIPVLARTFYDMVRNFGRNSEFWLVLRLAWRSNPFKWIPSMKMAWRLWRRERLSGGRDRIRDPASLGRMLDRIVDAEAAS